MHCEVFAFAGGLQRPSRRHHDDTTAALHCIEVLVFGLFVKVIIFPSSQRVTFRLNVTMESNRNK